MWHILVLTVMASLTALYLGAEQKNVIAAEQVKVENSADNMALYREAVITYFSKNPSLYHSVDINTLKASNVLPTWSTLYTQPAAAIWTNYRDSDGMIYIFASAPPPNSIVADVLKLSQNSVLAGVYRNGDSTLYSPVFGDTGIKLPLPAMAPIPHGSPVWIAMIR
ncbi:type IV pilus biogenesis protein PilM [Herbaspirillum sp. GCM10030257]|uniref:type IV pilus biogenesis protein PilM n=1 Tax=Herbaspirillum sp. GCM10030257 TaxID=3273393 RepID=UPI00360ABC76